MILDTRDVNLFFNDLGNGLPLLCLHAYPVDSTIWRAQYPLAASMRLIVPDVRGMGRSEAPVEPPLMDVLAEDVVALLDHLAIDRAVVMGLSLGGYVALALYRRFPQRIRGLIFADTRADADTAEMRERRLRAAAGLRKDGVTAVLGAIPMMFGTTTKGAHPELIAEEEHHVAEADAEGLALIQLAMAERSDSTDLLSQIAVPTLLLCGEEDPASPPDTMRAMAEQIPNARFALIPAAGHYSPLENPAAFNREVEAFMRGLA